VDFVLSTVGTGMVVGVPAHDKRDFDFAKKFSLPIIRVVEGLNGDRRAPEKVDEVFEEYGKAFNSGFLDGLSSEDAMVKIGGFLADNKIGSVVIRYHLRDWIFS
jgi:leucyl-tRNA synthetase